MEKPLFSFASPVRVSGISANISDELRPEQRNYGQLQVAFEDGSVGWYEAGWGPMVSVNAFFVKDVFGPKGSVSIQAKNAGSDKKSDDIDSHTKTEMLRLHHSELDSENHFVKEDEWSRLKNDMAELALSYPDTNIIGSGGNINKLYRMIEKKDKKRARMTVASLEELHNELKQLTVAERMQKFNLKPDRADVIVPAGDIFLTIAGIIKATYIYVPVIGLADGVIDGIYLRNKWKALNNEA